MYSKKLVFWAACLGMLLFGMVMLSMGTINTFLTTSLNLDELKIASLAALLPFGILVGSFLFGPIVDRFGFKLLLIVSAALIFLAFEGIAVAQTLPVIQLSFFLIGLAGGAINGATNALVSDISTEKGARLSLLGVFYGIGALGMPIVLGCSSRYISYKTTIIGIGLFVLLPLAFFITISFPAPKHAQGFPIKAGFKLLKSRYLILLGLFLFFESGIEGIANNWTTTYFKKELLLSSDKALYALSFLILFLTLTRLFHGYWLKKIPPYIVLFISMGAAFSGALVILLSHSMAGAIIGLSLMGIGFAAGFPVVLGYTGELYPQFSGTAFSIVFVIALLGNTSLNYLVGIITNAYGIKTYITVPLISIIIMTGLLFFIIRDLGNKIKI